LLYYSGFRRKVSSSSADLSLSLSLQRYLSEISCQHAFYGRKKVLCQLTIAFGSQIDQINKLPILSVQVRISIGVDNLGMYLNQFFDQR
jgi:hypothetical protein